MQLKTKTCDNCPRREPTLLKENIDVWELWMAVQTQWRTSFGGLIGLDYLAVENVARILKIDLDDWNLEKIQAMEKHVLRKQCEETEVKK